MKHPLIILRRELADLKSILAGWSKEPEAKQVKAWKSAFEETKAAIALLKACHKDPAIAHRIVRSAETGRFTSKAEAKLHPATTVVETLQRPSRRR